MSALPPSPPAEKATAHQDQAGQSRTGDGPWNPEGTTQPIHLAVDAIGEEKGIMAFTQSKSTKCRVDADAHPCDDPDQDLKPADIYRRSNHP